MNIFVYLVSTHVACVDLSGLCPPRQGHTIHLRWKLPIYFVEYDIYYSHTFHLKIPTFGIQFCNVTEHLIPLFFKSNTMVTVVYMILQTGNTFDVHGSVHHSTIHKENSNKMQKCINILLFHIYKKLNMFRVTHRPSPGA